MRAQAAPTSVKGGEAQQCPGRTDGMLSVQGARRREGVGQLYAEADRHDQGKPRADENWAVGRCWAPPSSVGRSSAPTSDYGHRRTISAGSCMERKWRINSNKTREVTQRLSLTHPDRLKANEEVPAMSTRREFIAAIRSTYRSELRWGWSTTVRNRRCPSLLNPSTNL
jgi:hypothetical protein